MHLIGHATVQDISNEQGLSKHIKFSQSNGWLWKNLGGKEEYNNNHQEYLDFQQENYSTGQI